MKNNEIRITPVGRRDETLSGANFENLKWVDDNAEPTFRMLSGSRDHGYAEEWQQRCETQYGIGIAYFLIGYDEVAIAQDRCPDNPAEEYPWDADHCDHIEVVVD
jgi:hypothetical protein